MLGTFLSAAVMKKTLQKERAFIERRVLFNTCFPSHMTGAKNKKDEWKQVISWLENNFCHTSSCFRTVKKEKIPIRWPRLHLVPEQIGALLSIFHAVFSETSFLGIFNLS